MPRFFSDGVGQLCERSGGPRIQVLKTLWPELGKGIDRLIRGQPLRLCRFRSSCASTWEDQGGQPGV